MFKQKAHAAVLVVAVTLLLMTALQMRQIIIERDVLSQQFAAQEEPLARVQQVNAQFESLAVGTARLAGEGNAAAQQIIAGLGQVGITVNPNATEGQKSLEFKQPEQPQQPVTTESQPQTPPAAPAVGN